MTKLTKRERHVLAAVFGGSNMGLERPRKERVRRELDADAEVASLAYTFWSGYMESDEIEKAIVAECKDWYKTLGKETRESVTKIWPYMAALIWE